MSQSDSFKKVKRNIRTPDGYKKLSQWTSAQTVELGDGNTLESRYASWDAAKAHADSAHARTDATKTEASSSNGYLKINGTETKVYTHPSTSGYRHIPAGGQESQILKCSGNGSAAWGDFPSGNVYTGVCATLQGASAKTVECPGFQLYDGARVMVTFTKGSTTNYLTLNVNGTGAYFAWFPLGQTRSFNDKAISKLIAAGCAYEFIFQEGGTEKDSKWVYCGVVSTAESMGINISNGHGGEGIPKIVAAPNAGSGGLMEIGKYIDFHEVGSQSDFDARLYCENGELISTSPIRANVLGNAASATKAVQDGNGKVISDTYLSKQSVMSKGSAYTPVYFDARGNAVPCSSSIPNILGYSNLFSHIIFPLLGLPDDIDPETIRYWGDGSGGTVQQWGYPSYDYIIAVTETLCINEYTKPIMICHNPDNYNYGQKVQIGELHNGIDTYTLYFEFGHYDGEDAYIYTSEPYTDVNFLYAKKRSKR